MDLQPRRHRCPSEQQSWLNVNSNTRCTCCYSPMGSCNIPPWAICFHLTYNRTTCIISCVIILSWINNWNVRSTQLKKKPAMQPVLIFLDNWCLTSRTLIDIIIGTNWCLFRLVKYLYCDTYVADMFRKTQLWFNLEDKLASWKNKKTDLYRVLVTKIC